MLLPEERQADRLNSPAYQRYLAIKLEREKRKKIVEDGKKNYLEDLQRKEKLKLKKEQQNGD